MYTSTHRPGGAGPVLLAFAVVLAACTSGDGRATQTVPTGATTFAEYRAAFCRSWESLFRAIGNPDTGSGSELSEAMDSAIAVGDIGKVDVLASRIQEELAAGRRDIAYATSFAPGAPLMAQMDRLFVGFGVMIETRRIAARDGPRAADERGQSAFEATGAIDAWRALLTPENWSALDASRPAGEPRRDCENVPVGL